MRGWNRSRWMWSVSVGVLGGALLATSVVGADDDKKGKNPFTQILEKLDQILSKLDSSGQESNHTLRWDQNLHAAQRFVVLAAFNNEAVLDKNTGLVWERSPNTTVRTSWTGAIHACVNREVGRTLGWRLPSVAELASLLDLSLGIPWVPVPASVFIGIQPAVFWSSTEVAGTPSAAWAVVFADGPFVDRFNKGGDFGIWCVRGPMQESVY